MPTTDPFSTVHGTEPVDPQALKKRKLWRNLFLFSLCITFLLVGLFWVPIKMVQMENFVSAPSVNLPKKGAIPGGPSSSNNTLVAPIEQLTSLDLLETVPLYKTLA